MGLKPGYKQTEVGVIPEDWEVSTVGAEFSIQLGKMLDAEKNVGVLKPFLGNRSVQWGYFDLTVIGEIRLTPSDLQRFRLREGDLLVCEGGEVGRAAIWHQPLEECYYQKALHRLRPTRSYDVGLMFYMLQWLSATGFLLNFVTQTSIAHLPKDKFEAVPIPLLPTDAEQEAIAETLSDADALIECLEQLLAKKRHLKQGAIQELLTGKKRLPGFAGKWQVKPLGDLFNFSGGFTASRDQLSSEGYCYLHYGDIHASKKMFVDVRSEFQDIPKLDIPLNKAPSASLLGDGDVVFVDASEDDEGTSRHVVVFNPDRIPFISGLHTIVAKSKGTGLDKRYRCYCFQTAEVKAQFKFFAVGTKVSGISKSNIARVVIRVPTAPEQAAIATVLSDMDADIAILEAKLAKARHLKQGMMQELLTGRIRLARPSASVVPISAEQKAVANSGKSHNPQINEAVVIAVLASRFGTEQYPLARVRRTKLAYLLHRHVEHEAPGFLKKAAGPYDPKTRYGGPEKIALKNRYVCKHHNGTYEGFVAADNIKQAQDYFENWYGPSVLEWLEQFRYKSTEELELVSTVDMASEELRHEGKAVTSATVKMVLRANAEWRAKLDRPIFADEKVSAAICLCDQLFATEGGKP